MNDPLVELREQLLAELCAGFAQIDNRLAAIKHCLPGSRFIRFPEVVEAPPGTVPPPIDEAKDILKAYLDYFGDGGSLRLAYLFLLVTGVPKFNMVPVERLPALIASAQADMAADRERDRRFASKQTPPLTEDNDDDDDEWLAT